MQIGSAGVFLIKQFEGCARKRTDGKFDAYPDPGSGGDPWTIGWGSTGAGIVKGTVWTQEQCDTRLAADVTSFSARVAKVLGNARTTQNQFDAMVCLAYNIGMTNFSGSTLLAKHLAGDYGAAQAQFGRWNRAGGKVMGGLTKRRTSEAQLYGRVS